MAVVLDYFARTEVSASDGPTSYSVTVTGASVGDTVVIARGIDYADNTAAIPAITGSQIDWTELGPLNSFTNGEDVRIFRAVGTVLADNPTFGVATGDRWAGASIAVFVLDGEWSLVGSAITDNQNGANGIAPAVAGAVVGDHLFCAWQAEWDQESQWSTPGTMVAPVHGTASGAGAISGTYQVLTSSGSTGTRTATQPSAKWAAASVVMRPPADPVAPTVNAGADVASHPVGAVFTRTATGTDSPTSWAWTIVSGPAGVGSTIGTAAALSWTPTVLGTYVLRATATNAVGSGSDTLTIAVDEGTLLWVGDAETAGFGEFFDNTGGIDILSPQTRAYVSSPTRAGSAAYEHVVNGVASNGSQRSESSPNFDSVAGADAGDGWIYEGANLWFAASIYLPSGFPTTPDDFQLVMQWKNDGTGSPPLSIDAGSYGSGNWTLSGGFGHPSGDLSMPAQNLGALVTGQWVDFLFHIKFSADPEVGSIEVYRDGALVLAEYFPPGGTMYPATPEPLSYWKIGLYRGAELATPVTIYHDEMRVGTTRAIVEPAPAVTVVEGEAAAPLGALAGAATGAGFTPVTGTAAAPLGGLDTAAAGEVDVTGTASAPLGALAASAAGTGFTPVTGTAAAGLGGLAAAAAGDVDVDGTAAAPLGALDAASTGTRTVDATATAPLGGLAGTAQGVVSAVITGTAAAPLGALDGAAAGTRSAPGAAAAPLGGLDTGAVGVVQVAGQAAAGLGALDVAATGTRNAPGTGTAGLGALTAAVVGAVDVTGQGTAPLGALDGSATGAGYSTITGTGAAPLGALTTSALGTVQVDGEGAAPLGGLDAAASARVALRGTAAAPLGGLTARGTGEGAVAANGTAALGGLDAAASGDVAVTGQGSANLGTLDAAGAGVRALTGQGSAPLGGLAASAVGTGHSTITGAADAPLGALTGTGAGTVDITGQGSAPLGALNTAAVGRVDAAGQAVAELGALTGTGAGVVQTVGQATAELGALATAGAGDVDVVGQAPAALGGLDAVATGAVASTGTAAAPLGGLSAVATAGGQILGQAAAPLGALDTAATGERATTGQGAAPLGGLDAVGSGVVARAITGTATAPLGALDGAGTGIIARAAAATALLGGLGGAAAGVRTTTGEGGAGLGGLDATATGERAVTATATAGLGGLDASADAAGIPDLIDGVALAELGALVAVGVARPFTPARRLSATATTAGLSVTGTTARLVAAGQFIPHMEAT